MRPQERARGFRKQRKVRKKYAAHPQRTFIALYLAFCFAPAIPAQTPAANPARPTVTNPATLPPVGYLQFEQGYLGSIASPETRSQYGINQTAKLTVAPRLMIEIQSQPFAVGTSNDSPQSTRDAGDVLFGAQAVLYNPPPEPDTSSRPDVHRHAHIRSAVPTVAFAYLNRVHSGTAPDIDLGSQSRTAVFLFSGHAPGIDVHYDTNLIASEQDGELPVPGSTTAIHTVRRAQFGETFSIDRALFDPNLQFSLEVYHLSQPLVHSSADGQSVARANLVDGLFALSYQLRPNLVFDGGFAHGFTSTSTRWQSFAGFTYLLPHRLWPAKNHAKS